MANDYPLWLILNECTLKDANGNELSSKQSCIFCEFMMMLSFSSKKTWTARGDSDANLQRHYNTDTSNPQLLSLYLFNIGAKGRLCLHTANGINPEDTSSSNFRNICELLKSALDKAAKGQSNRAIKMRKFISKNSKFVNSFLSDISHLVSKYENLSISERKKINIYYLYILHTINSRDYNAMSNFVSVSENLCIAREFAESTLIVGWVPTHPLFSLVSYRKTDEFSDLCKSAQLPYIDRPVYQEQAEISILCGILPHFIIGFRVGNDFYVNPAIFKTMGLFAKCYNVQQILQLKTDIVTNGLIVDQHNFIEYCNMTNYKKYFTYDGLQYRLYNL